MYKERRKAFPEPFKIQLLELQLHLVDCALRKSPFEKRVEKRRLKKLIKALQVKAFKVIKELSEEEKETAIYKEKEVPLKNSWEIGLNPIDAIRRDDWVMIAELLAAKGQIQRMCSVSTEEFDSFLKFRLNEELHEFARLSSKCDESVENGSTFQLFYDII